MAFILRKGLCTFACTERSKSPRSPLRTRIELMKIECIYWEDKEESSETREDDVKVVGGVERKYTLPRVKTRKCETKFIFSSWLTCNAQTEKYNIAVPSRNCPYDGMDNDERRQRAQGELPCTQRAETKESS